MTDILLITEDFVKSNSNLPDNLYGEWLLPAIREAQDIGLQGVLGTRLYCKVCGEVADNSIEERIGNLIQVAQPYIMYQTIADLIPVISVKLGNIGAVISNDEHVQNISKDQRENLQYSYRYKADHYKMMLQRYLINHRDLYPELECSDCCQGYIKPDLGTSYSTGLWLGGKRTLA